MSRLWWRVSAVVTLSLVCSTGYAQVARSSGESSGVDPRRTIAARQAIMAKWRELDADQGPLGRATSRPIESCRGGRYMKFQGGFVFWRKELGAHAVYGEIARKWVESGREIALGIPISDERPAANGGRYSDFEGGYSIYWSPDTGAHTVGGPIRREWLAQGGAAGALGYPTADASCNGRDRRAEFQYGFVVYYSSNRTTVSGMFEHCELCIDGSAQCGVGEVCAARGGPAPSAPES